MPHVRFFGAAFLFLVMAVHCAVGQTVRLSVYQGNIEWTIGWFSSSEDVRIDLAHLHTDYPGFEFIRVGDTATPQGDVARISVYRSAAIEVPATVKILVGAAESNGRFPVAPDADLLPGCRHWGLPLTPGGPDDAFVIEGSVPEGTKVILAAAINGDLTGKITTGQVFRLQVRDGVIADDVRATWPSGSPELDTDTSLSYAIEYIEAKSITGRIIAGDETGPPVNPLPVHCSIRDIRVGVGYEETTQGIRGDIDAFGGHVRNVESAGDIGTAQVPVKINTGPGVAGNTPRATPASAGTG
ncbi:MAG: hypothetical protein DYG92_11870 [Leptolyngbya sp. PLA1]|nr:hypothetical protein [Leptolyngbya sp. PLA1]